MATFTNQASLSYNNTVTTSNVTVGELLEVLSATKTAVVNTYGNADRVTYVISIVNAGTTPLTGLTLTDDLGGYEFVPQGQPAVLLYPLAYVADSALFYVNGALQPTPAVTPGPPLVIEGINVPAQGNATLIYEASVTTFAPLEPGSTIVNTATLSASPATQVTVSETVTVEAGPDLGISKSLSPLTVTENGRITYTFTIQNESGTATQPTDQVVLSDTFDPILSDLTVSFNSTPWTSPAQYSYDPTTGLFTTVPGAITVAGATFEQNPVTGERITTPGVSVLTVSGTI